MIIWKSKRFFLPNQKLITVFFENSNFYFVKTASPGFLINKIPSITYKKGLSVQKVIDRCPRYKS